MRRGFPESMANRIMRYPRDRRVSDVHLIVVSGVAAGACTHGVKPEAYF